jgi:hypothetical protein
LMSSYASTWGNFCPSFRNWDGQHVRHAGRVAQNKHLRPSAEEIGTHVR